jgi:spore germination cell wall hydrolase CwlJ-like protein
VITLDAYTQFVIPALTIWREARGEGFDAMRAVGWVITNRLLDKRWPNTQAGVCLQPKQFSCFNKNDANAVKLPTPGSDEWAAFEVACAAWEDQRPDPTNGANHYHSKMPNGALPGWADPDRIVYRAGAFTFYKL